MLIFFGIMTIELIASGIGQDAISIPLWLHTQCHLSRITKLLVKTSYYTAYLELVLHLDYMIYWAAFSNAS
jgi:hypothetical protein